MYYNIEELLENLFSIHNTQLFDILIVYAGK